MNSHKRHHFLCELSTWKQKKSFANDHIHHNDIRNIKFTRWALKIHVSYYQGVPRKCRPLHRCTNLPRPARVAHKGWEFVNVRLHAFGPRVVICTRQAKRGMRVTTVRSLYCFSKNIQYTPLRNSRGKT